MRPKEIFDPIEVITWFRNGKLHPLRFRWKGKVYKIRHIHGQWYEHIGKGRQIHFSVSENNSTRFEILFNSGDFTWQLARIDHEKNPIKKAAHK